MQALKITAQLASPVISYMGLHLDAILAYAVVERQTDGEMFVSEDYVRIELPLAVTWESKAGVPLWSSTDLLPVGIPIEDVQYFHRRAIGSRMSKKNIRTGTGRHKEKRVPMPTINVPELVAYAMGDAEQIAELLSGVTAIGKKRAGRVMAWHIEEVESFSFFDEYDFALCPVPCESRGVMALDAHYVAFSPPYWHSATRAFCWLTGTQC